MQHCILSLTNSEDADNKTREFGCDRSSTCVSVNNSTDDSSGVCKCKNGFYRLNLTDECRREL